MTGFRKKKVPRIISLDPGGTTGVASLYYTKDSVKLVSVSQVPGGLDGFLDWAEKNPPTSYDVVVCEGFTLRPGIHGADLTPTYIIGALTALCRNKTEVVIQKPSQKALCDDDRLKIMGMYKSGQPHSNDAVRHGIIYLRNEKHLPTLKLGWSE